MPTTPTSIAGRLRNFVRSHALATGISVALAAGVAGLGAGFALAAPSPAAAAESPTGAITSATTTSGAATHRIIRGLVGLTVKDTGQTLAQVRTLLRQDETLNQIAGGQAATVVQAAEAAVTSKVNAEVAASKLTSAQAATLTTRVDNRIHQVMAAPGRHVLLALRGGASSSPQASPAASPSPSPAS
ncbi:MAG: hypothetical protein ABSH07_01480 [Candidatus Dormibacteria bacterium]|jgi:hypothetical protein